MAEYRKDIYLLSYTRESVVLEIPHGIFLYVLQVDSIQSVTGHLLDIIISDKDSILYSGPLDNDIKRLTFHNLVSRPYEGNRITVRLTPNKALRAGGNRWGVFNDCIKISAIGYEVESIIDLTDGGRYSNEFLEEWE